MNIRDATADNLIYLADLWHERRVILHQSDSRFDVPEKSVWIEQTEALMKRERETSRLFMAQADDDATPIGYIMGRIDPHHIGIVEDIALDAHKYHAGLGRALWLAMQQWLTEAQARQILMHVPRYHPVEQAFWRAIGAKPLTTENLNAEITLQAWMNDTWKTAPERMWMTL